MILLEQPNAEQLALIYKELNMTPEGIEHDVKYLKEWYSLQPHLPKGIDERRLRNLLFFCKNSVEKVKHTIDLYYTVRGQVPEFYDRDPLDPDFQKYLNNMFIYPLPKLTPDGSRIIVFHLFKSDPELYNFLASVKITFMAGDIRLLEDTCLSDILIFDLKTFTLSHVLQLTIPLVKKFMFVGHEAFPIRQRAVHIINTPPFIDKILMFFKPFMKEKLLKRLHVHTQGLGNLHDYIPPSVLVEEFGGDQPSLKVLHEKWKKKLIDSRDFFVQESKIITDESKRPGKAKTKEELFGMEGSFRTLSID